MARTKQTARKITGGTSTRSDLSKSAGAAKVQNAHKRAVTKRAASRSNKATTGNEGWTLKLGNEIEATHDQVCIHSWSMSHNLAKTVLAFKSPSGALCVETEVISQNATFAPVSCVTRASLLSQLQALSLRTRYLFVSPVTSGTKREQSTCLANEAAAPSIMYLWSI